MRPSNKAICILGMHRSGTSALARTINLLGAYIGEPDRMMPSVAGDNPEGFWEHMDIYSLHERILSALGRSWDSESPLPDRWWTLPAMGPYRNELRRLVAKKFYGHRLWLWKDPRTSILLPLWQEVLRHFDIQVSYIICARNPVDVARSLGRRNGLSPLRSYALWQLHTAAALHWTSGMERAVVFYDALLDNWRRCLVNVFSSFGLPWPLDRFRDAHISSFLNPHLRHSLSSLDLSQCADPVPAPVQELFRLTLRAARDTKTLHADDFSSACSRLYLDYCRYAELFSPAGVKETHALVPSVGSGSPPRSYGAVHVIPRTGEVAEEDPDADIEEVTLPAADSPEVSIVIPVWNRWAYTYRCLCCLAANTNGVPYEVIIVDNGSSDRTTQLLSRVQNAVVIRNQANEGFVIACNQGAAVSKGKYLVFLNNDTEPLAGWLTELMAPLDSDNRIGAVGAKLIYPDGTLQEAGGMIFSDGSSLTFGRGDDPQEEIYNVSCEVDYCSAACLLVRKDLFTAVGGFDVRYSPAYYEDVDLCFSVRKKGFSVFYNPDACVVHWESVTGGSDETQGFRRYIAVNRMKFIEKWKAELTHQDLSPWQGKAPAMACRQRLEQDGLTAEDILPMDVREDSPRYRHQTALTYRSMIYRTLPEKEEKSLEILRRAARYFPPEDIWIEWDGTAASAVVVHLILRAFHGTIPFNVRDGSISTGQPREIAGIQDGAVIGNGIWNDHGTSVDVAYFSRSRGRSFLLVQPLLHFREIDLWQYIRKHDVPAGEIGLSGASDVTPFWRFVRAVSPVLKNISTTHAGPLSEFEARISVEDLPSHLKSDTLYSMRVRIINPSSATWLAGWLAAEKFSVNLSYHWLDEEGQTVLHDGIRTPLPQRVNPGDEIILDATVLTPAEPRLYNLEFDLVQEGIAWFGERGSQIERLALRVEKDIGR